MKWYLTTVFVPVCDFEKRKSVRQMSLSLNQLGVLFQTEHHNESRSHAKTRKREKVEKCFERNRREYLTEI